MVVNKILVSAPPRKKIRKPNTKRGVEEVRKRATRPPGGIGVYKNLFISKIT